MEVAVRISMLNTFVLSIWRNMAQLSYPVGVGASTTIANVSVVFILFLGHYWDKSFQKNCKKLSKKLKKY